MFFIFQLVFFFSPFKKRCKSLCLNEKETLVEIGEGRADWQGLERKLVLALYPFLKTCSNPRVFLNFSFSFNLDYCQVRVVFGRFKFIRSKD